MGVLVTSKKNPDANASGSLVVNLVGTTGFEPVTSWSRTRRTTKLCYVPI